MVLKLLTLPPMAVKDKLNSIQYQALKICVGAVSRTSLEKLQVECGVPPLALRGHTYPKFMLRLLLILIITLMII